jgi:RHS repeat-associated protein
MLDIHEVDTRGACPELQSESNLSYYRARYYDQSAGRFVSEDPFGFGAGVDFYRYVYNSPAGLADPMGLSPADVQRIQAKCKKCTQGLTDAGMRLNGGNGDTTLGFVGSLLTGGINDLLSAHRENSTNKKQSCYSQAVMTKPCLEDPKPPYGGDWQFNVERIWGGSHRVVIGRDSDPGDPVVICDPWLNRTYTLPKPPAGPTGGGSAF